MSGTVKSREKSTGGPSILRFLLCIIKMFLLPYLSWNIREKNELPFHQRLGETIKPAAESFPSIDSNGSWQSLLMGGQSLLGGCPQCVERVQCLWVYESSWCLANLEKKKKKNLKRNSTGRTFSMFSGKHFWLAQHQQPNCHNH